jgi:hypothetical protein
VSIPDPKFGGIPYYTQTLGLCGLFPALSFGPTLFQSNPWLCLQPELQNKPPVQFCNSNSDPNAMLCDTPFQLQIHTTNRLVKLANERVLLSSHNQLVEYICVGNCLILSYVENSDSVWCGRSLTKRDPNCCYHSSQTKPKAKTLFFGTGPLYAAGWTSNFLNRLTGPDRTDL